MSAIDTARRPQTPTVTVEFDVAVPSNDGASLRAHVYRPGDEGPCPTVLTGIGDGSSASALPVDPVAAARQGHIVVVVEALERLDERSGFEAVEWAAQLPGADGRVVLCGSGKAADLQWATAARQPPSLAGIAATLTRSSSPDGPAQETSSTVEVPSLHIGGWHDPAIRQTLDRYLAMTSRGRSARLLVGPWSEVPQTEGSDLSDRHLRWMRDVLDPGGSDSPETAPVRIFVMGRNEWRDETSWPLERARVEPLFLRTHGQLRSDAPLFNGESTEYAYDPADPVPTVGGTSPGPREQTQIEARPDVCLFTTEPLVEDLEVTGAVRVILHAESSAPTTDWVVRLCDVHPDGRSFDVCDGITRVAEGAQSARRLEIDLSPTSNVFRAGHRLRLHVTSSSVPRWDRNRNTDAADDPYGEVAHQRIHHDAFHPSCLELPVVG